MFSEIIFVVFFGENSKRLPMRIKSALHFYISVRLPGDILDGVERSPGEN